MKPGSLKPGTMKPGSLNAGTVRRAILIFTAFACASAAFAGGAAATPNQPQVSAGAAGTCAVFANQKVYCWGSNARKQLGIGENSLSYALAPIPVNGLNGLPKTVAAGYDSACALLDFGSLRCWGNNRSGLLGARSRGHNASHVQQAARLATGVSTAIALGVGQGHLCYVDVDKTVKCQGLGSTGQLGVRSFSSATTPVAITELGQPATQVVTGSGHTCALLANKNVRCWGSNALGQLGQPASVAYSTIPSTVPDLPNDVTRLSAGANHTCALRPGGDVTCWGANSFGQLGDGTISPFKGTVDVKSLGTTTADIAAGETHTCARFKTGNVRCWGGNAHGQLGNGNTTRALAPTTVAGLVRPVAELTAGAEHTCVRLDDGGIRCWGRGDRGQLGNGSRSDSPTPVALAASAGPSFSKVHVLSRHGRSSFIGLFVVKPPVPGSLRKRCRGKVVATVSVTQNDVTRRRGIRSKLRASGSKCVATLRANRISKEITAADVQLRASFRGNSRLPAAQYSQSFTGV